MATEKSLQILESIKALTILELADLVKAVEEEFGVSAAAPVAVAGAGAAAPPAEIIDVILDRPFVFAICTDQIPLFVGTVNVP